MSKRVEFRVGTETFSTVFVFVVQQTGSGVSEQVILAVMEDWLDGMMTLRLDSVCTLLKGYLYFIRV
jgi:hypothetical protein